jgi:hypothetical protein
MSCGRFSANNDECWQIAQQYFLHHHFICRLRTWWHVTRGRIAAMNTHRHNALAAILARIDQQIVESDALLLKSLTGRERHRVTDELAYLQLERLKAAANLLSKH